MAAFVKRAGVGRALRIRLDASVALALGALALRLLFLDRQAIVVDEAYTVRAALLPAAEIVALPEQTPPLYNLLMHAWVGLAGTSEWALRLPSALFGAAAVGVLHRVATHLAPAPVPLVAAVLLGLSSTHLAYSQTARTYALFTLATLGSFLALLAWLRSGRRAHAGAYVAVTAVMLYAHVYGLLYLAAQAVTVAAVRAGDRRRALTAFAPLAGLALLLFLPWSGILAARAGAVLQGFWIPPIGLDTLKAIGWTFGVHYGDPWLVRLGSAAVFALAAWGAIALLRRPWPPTALEPQPRGMHAMAPRAALWTCTAAIAVPLLVPLAFSLAVRPVFTPWYVLPSIPFLLLLAAAGAWMLPRRAWATGATAAVVGLFVAGAAAYAVEPHGPDWRSLTHTLEEQAAPGDLVVNSFGYCDSASDQDMQCALEHYLVRQDLRLHPFVDSYFRGMTEEDLRDLDEALEGRTRVWAVFSEHLEPRHVLRDLLDERFERKAHWEFGEGVELALYRTR